MNPTEYWNGVSAPYQIEQSLRFERTDSAHLRRTFGTPTTQNVYTYSTWLKYIGCFLRTKTTMIGALYKLLTA
jgi:hypothetical protein